MIYLKSDAGNLVPLSAVRIVEDGCRPAEHPALRPAAFGDDFVRPAARHVSGRGHG